MNFDLRAALPFILPKAIAWVELRQAEILENGVPLNDYGLSIARQVGVAQPELIRVALFEQIPLPSDPQLQQAAQATGLFSPHMAGITLGYGICILQTQNSIRLLSHECRHVHQYEQASSIANFLEVYLQQIIEHGYQNAPLECDARNHEIHA